MTEEAVKAQINLWSCQDNLYDITPPMEEWGEGLEASQIADRLKDKREKDERFSAAFTFQLNPVKREDDDDDKMSSTFSLQGVAKPLKSEHVCAAFTQHVLCQSSAITSSVACLICWPFILSGLLLRPFMSHCPNNGHLEHSHTHTHTHSLSLSTLSF